MKNGQAARRQQRDRRALTIAAGAVGVLLLVSAGLWQLTRSAEERRGVGGPFTLVADTGKIVTDRSFSGKYLAIYFGYTNCQDVCPTTLTTLSAALARLGQTADHVQPLFITVDPERDSPAVLHRFVANFSPALVGLTGSETALNEVGREFHVLSISHRIGSPPATYAVDHSSVIYLLAPDGTFIAPIPADASEMVVAQAIAHYVKAL